MKKSLETLGGLLIVGGLAGFVHHLFGWAPFGFVARIARATPLVRDHEYVTYAVLIVLGLGLLLVPGDEDDEDGEDDDEEGS
ncbi:hypothetical protein [Actinomadura sp. DC4]|uniref:hypothetical protein n=1 Tax=Actinomadura sp. DC4 TaxID=3055069 RepID=UPI0025B1FF52|nr:hypothetical protein [Actinomadura sp. DC4]MDN3357942.1 hypothetical protein [Actinomadura sp. DC4]